MALVVLSQGQSSNNNLQAEIDIIAVHGLDPRGRDQHALNTWRQPRRDGGHVWLRDALPGVLPQARTMIYSYNSNPFLRSSNTRLVHEAGQLLEAISLKRLECPDRKIILIGHSLGGILIKQALVIAKASMNPVHQDVFKATFALVFLAVPHAGPSKTLTVRFGNACASISKEILGSDSTDLMKALEFKSMFRDILEESWKHQLGDRPIISVYGIDDKVVPRESSVLGLPGDKETIIRMNADHGGVCRFDPTNSIDQDNYIMLEGALIRVCRAALKPDKDQRAMVSHSLKKDILDSLQAHGSNPRYARIEQEHEDTLQWIWATEDNEGPGLLEWLGVDGGIFWVSGKPGAGKSTLVKYINDEERTMTELQSSHSAEVLMVSFFFYEQGLPSEKTFSGLLHGLLSQILVACPDLFSLVQARFNRLSLRSKSLPSNDSIWSEPELEKAFKDILSSKTTRATIFCIIDGLDECRERDLHPLLQFLLKLVAYQKGAFIKFKILCSSRPETPIELAFTNVTNNSTLRVQDFNSEDIKNFVVQRFAAITDNLNPCEDFHRISDSLITDIVWKANGVFIWVKLVMAELLIAVEAGDIEVLDERLDELPSDLEDLYTRIIDKIPLALRHHTFNTLQLFPYLGTSGPDNLFGLFFTPPDPESALNSPPRMMRTEDKIRGCIQTKRVVQNRCRSLINMPLMKPQWTHTEIINNFCRGEVSVHKTVRDYLSLNNNMERICSSLNPELLVRDQYAQFASYYFSLLKADPATQREALPNWSGSILPDDEALLRFIFCRLVISLRESESISKGNFIAPTWLPAIEAYLKTIYLTQAQLENFYDSCLIDSYISFERRSDEPPVQRWHSNLLSVAVYFKLYSYTREHLAEGEKTGRPLFRYCLDKGIDKPLDTALIRYMLGKGFDLNATFDGRTTWEYLLLLLLSHPSALEQSSYDRVLLLALEHGADPNYVVELGDYQSSPLHLILVIHSLPWERQQILLREFLDRGAHVNIRDSKGCSVLEMAEQNWPNAVPLLLPYVTGEEEKTLGKGPEEERVRLVEAEGFESSLLDLIDDRERYNPIHYHRNRHSVKTGEVYGMILREWDFVNSPASLAIGRM